MYADGGRTLAAHPGLHTVAARFASVAAGLIAPGVRSLFGSPILGRFGDDAVVGARSVDLMPPDAVAAEATAVGTGMPPVVSRWNPKAAMNETIPRTAARPMRRLVVSGRPCG